MTVNAGGSGQGPQGTRGFQGSQGAQGFQGAQGRQGFQGTPGPQGNQGGTGPQGNQGFQGDGGQFTQGLTYRGAWSNVTSYVDGDIVSYSGVSYAAVNPGVGQTPTDPNFWVLLVPTASNQTLTIPPSATGDDGPQLQALYDAGAGSATLQAGLTYTMKTPVFLDKGTTRGLGGFTLNLNGAKLVLDAALPQISEWNSNPTFTNSVTASAAIFPNTNRSALVSNVVTLTGNNTQGGMELFYVYGPGLVTSSGSPVGLVMSQKGASCTVEGVNTSALFLISWGVACDSNVARRCMAIASGSPAASRGMLVWDFLPSSPGDSHTIEDCKGDSSCWIATFVNSRSVSIRGAVAGIYKFVDCHGVTVEATHIEANLGNPSGQGVLIFDCTEAVVSGANLRTGRGTQYSIEVNDAQAEPHRTMLQLHGPTFDANLSTSDNDVTLPPNIQITNANKNTRIRAVGISATFTAGIDNGFYIPGGIFVASAITAITTALTTSRAAHLFAHGTWELRQRSSGWEVINPFSPAVTLLSKGLSPSCAISALSANVRLGSLLTSTTYAYAMATKDARGVYGPSAQVGSITTPSTNFKGIVRLNPTIGDQPRVLCIWRQAGAGSVSSPDHYAEWPLMDYSTYLYDTGANLQGLLWKTTSLPSVPGTDGTVDGIIFSDSGAASHIEVWGPGIPTTGTWAQGDRVNSTVAVTTGDPSGWVCTVAGSPGTWHAFGVLT